MTQTPPLSQRLSIVKPSATVAVSTRAQELKRQGIDVLSFSVGEPDFDTPTHIREAAKTAIDNGATRYTASRGTPELREAICASSEKRRGHKHASTEVVVSVGAKHTLANLANALYDPGDEVVIPAPYWVSYPEQVALAGATPVIVETREEDNFLMSPAQLKGALTSRTKAVVICTPSNPTGFAYSPAQLRALADVLASHSCWIVVDEIYAQLVYGDFEQKSILEVAPELCDRIIIVDGVSKTFAMTGWRIGWMLAPKHVATACDTLQSQATTNPATMAQSATIAALTGPWAPMEEMRVAFEQRRDLIVRGINAIEGISCRTPQGAFYVFVNVKGLLGKSVADKKLENDLDVASYWLEDARCAVVPGDAFGAPGYVRMSYAASNEVIEEGLRRIAASVAKLQ